MSWIAVIIPVISAILDFIVKVLLIILLLRLLSLAKDGKFFIKNHQNQNQNDDFDKS